MFLFFCFQEVQAILRTSLARNMVRESLHEKRQAFEAWRQVVEILLTSCPEDLLTGEARQNVLFELLQDLLKKVLKVNALLDMFVLLIADFHFSFVVLYGV